MFVMYLYAQRCSVEVYLEGLLKPCVESGELGRLTDQMLLIDPSLEKWNSYLTASCRYFLKHKLHHVLYEFQIFMKVQYEILNLLGSPSPDSVVCKFYERPISFQNGSMTTLSSHSFYTLCMDD